MADAPPPPEPTAAAPVVANQGARTGCGVAAVAIGGVILGTAGLCTGAFAWGMRGDSGLQAMATAVGAPFLFLGLVIFALGLRFLNSRPGRAPIWHIALGGLLAVIGGVGALNALWEAGQAVVNAAPGADVVAGLGRQVLPLVMSLLTAWVGVTLTRPRR